MLASAVAAGATVVVLAIGGAPEGRADSAHVAAHGHGAAKALCKPKQLAFHDAMRKLWEDHVTWTRLAIVSFAGDLPDLQATEERLLQNQVDIGDAIKPYYGKAAGNKLTALLKEHILGAVTLLQAAKSGDQDAISKASADWYVNGDEIADFLHSANPKSWKRGVMRSMMKVHLDQTLDEATHRLQGDYEADVKDYEAIHEHMLEMADMLSAGIMRQFPKRF